MRIPYEVPVSFGKEFIELESEVTAAILRTLAAGWQHAQNYSDLNSQACEVLMTERLRDGMRNELKTKGHPWGKMLIVLPGTESRSNNEVVIPDGRTDIPIMLIEVFLSMQVHDPHAIIECKRIAGSDTHLCREYVVQGVDRFRTGKYGINHAVGFMAGYLVSGGGDDAVTGINAYLARTKRNVEFLKSDNICEDAQTWGSLHQRLAPSPPIRMCHVFLGFPDSNATGSTPT